MARKHTHPPRSQKQAREMKLYGANACAAVWKLRREDIIRAYVLSSDKQNWGEMLRWCAQQRRAYHLVEAEELERVSGSLHHEGICMLVRERPPLTEAALLRQLEAERAPVLLVFLDDVGNPHNVGAILRSAAHFSVAAVLVHESAEVSLAGAASRVAEGGAEVVPLVRLKDASHFLTRLRKLDFALFATSSHAKRSLFDAPLPKRAVLLLGAEGEGLSPKLRKLADHDIVIPGSGAVESLNVACAVTVMLGEWWRANRR